MNMLSVEYEQPAARGGIASLASLGSSLGSIRLRSMNLRDGTMLTLIGKSTG